MGIEQRPVQESARLRNLKDQATLVGIRLVSPIVKMGTENIIRNVEARYEEGVKAKLTEAKEQEDVIVVVVNHQSLADTLVCIEPLNTIRRFSGAKGYGLPYTMTVANGDKGADVKGLHDVLEQKLKDNLIEPIYLSRTSDHNKFKTPLNLREVYKAYKTCIKDGYALAIHAEGRLDAGRRGKNGERQGMQHFQTNALRSIIDVADKFGRNVTIVPISISGSFNIHDPQTGRITRNTLRVGLNFSDKSLANVFVSQPMNISEGVLGQIRNRNPHMNSEDWDEFNAVIERKIASHLPPSQRGVVYA